jgi:thioredoxin reductase
MPDQTVPGPPERAAGEAAPMPDQAVPRGPARAAGGPVDITVDGAAWQVPGGVTIAAAFIQDGQPAWRRTRLRGEPRGLSCGIGVCFDCLVTVNGTPGVRACLAEVRPGDVITTETGSGFTSDPPGLPGWQPDPAAGQQAAPGQRPVPGQQPATRLEPPTGPDGRTVGGSQQPPPRTGQQVGSAAVAGAAVSAPLRHAVTGLADCDVAVVGAGPAGLTAAVAAADAGSTVQVLDLGERPGGQYWRWGPATADGRFHHGWAAFTQLRDRFAAHQASGRIVYRPGHAVFQVEPPRAVAPGAVAGLASGTEAPFRIHAVAGDRERDYAGVQARAVVVATGAYDLQLPVPGWTLPGVMAAGAAQSLLKSSAVAAGRRVVVAGTGPFLLPVAAGLAQAGARVAAVVEAGQPLDYLRQPARLAGSWRKLPEAGGYLAGLARHRVPVLRRHAVIAARGDGRLESVTVARLDRDWRPVPGTERILAADVLAAGYGFVPQVELLGEAGAQLTAGAHLAPGAPAAVAVARADQQTTVPGLFTAGETTGVGGADLARAEGEIAGRAAARFAGQPIAPPRAAVRARAALRRFAAVMQDVHAVRPGWAGWLADETVVCRCEEVTLGRMRAAAGLGADDARSIKLLARPGMGWCQGRICGPVVDALLAAGLHQASPGAPPRPPGAGSPPAPDRAAPGTGTATAGAADQDAGATDQDAGAAAAVTLSRPLAQPVPLGVLARLAEVGAPPGSPDSAGAAGPAGSPGSAQRPAATGTGDAGAGTAPGHGIAGQAGPG